MGHLIEITDLTKSYWIGGQNLTILHGLDMEVEDGEFTAIMGASGSGKSTLLHILGCLDQQTSGRYSFAGHEMNNWSDKQISEFRGSQIGFIFQNFNLLSQLSVHENVALPFLYSFRPHADTEELVARALLQVGLTHRLQHRPAELSGGEMQRVAIARAIVTGPSLILADEPTGSLDSATGKEILAILQRLNDAGTAVILVIHDAEVAHQAGRRLMLKDGRFVA